MEKDSPVNEANWQQSIDPHLAQRLNRPGVQPGVVNLRMAENILGRVQRMTQNLPMHAALARKYQPVGAPAPRLPVVFAQTRSFHPDNAQGPTVEAQPPTADEIPQSPASGSIQTQQARVKAELSLNQTTAGNVNTTTSLSSAQEIKKAAGQTVVQANHPDRRVKENLLRSGATPVVSTPVHVPIPHNVQAVELARRPFPLTAPDLTGSKQSANLTSVTSPENMAAQPSNPSKTGSEGLTLTAASPQGHPSMQPAALPLVRGETRTISTPRVLGQAKGQEFSVPMGMVMPVAYGSKQGYPTSNILIKAASQPQADSQPASQAMPQGQAVLVYAKQGTEPPAMQLQRSTALPGNPPDQNAAGSTLYRAVEVNETATTEPVSENQSELDVDDLAEKVMRKLALSMRVERQRRGWLK